jgi:uncharacterized protein
MTDQHSPRYLELVRTLELAPHPEGGFFRESYRSEETIDRAHLPGRYSGPRAFSTAIYFLVPGGSHSKLHRVRSDELWHFYEGSDATLHLLHPDGRYEPVTLGPGGVYQALAPRGVWFGLDGIPPGSHALFGCTVAPGFEFADFELGSRQELTAWYPAHRALIERLTPPEA